MNGLFPVHDAGDVLGASGPWYNYRGLRVEIDVVSWTRPDGEKVWVAFTLLCPQCGHPVVLPARPDLVRVDEDGRLTVATVFQCPGYWPEQRDGMQVLGEDGRPRVARCGWSGVIRNGMAHRLTCRALHVGTCPAPGGGRCTCNFGGWDDTHSGCTCGAATRE